MMKKIFTFILILSACLSQAQTPFKIWGETENYSNIKWLMTPKSLVSATSTDTFLIVRNDTVYGAINIGNGIISALPLDDVFITGNNHRFRIDSLNEFDVWCGPTIDYYTYYLTGRGRLLLTKTGGGIDYRDSTHSSGTSLMQSVVFISSESFSTGQSVKQSRLQMDSTKLEHSIYEGGTEQTSYKLYPDSLAINSPVTKLSGNLEVGIPTNGNMTVGDTATYPVNISSGAMFLGKPAQMEYNAQINLSVAPDSAYWDLQLGTSVNTMYLRQYRSDTSTATYLNADTIITSNLKYAETDSVIGINNGKWYKTLVMAHEQDTAYGSTSGRIIWSMPFRNSNYKKAIIYFDALTDAGVTLTYPSEFEQTPHIYGDATVISICITNKKYLTISAS